MDEGILAQLALYLRSRNYAEKTIRLYVEANRRWCIDVSELSKRAVVEWVWGADTQSKRRHRWLAMKQLLGCLHDLGLLDNPALVTEGLKMPQEALKVLPAVSDDVLELLVARCKGSRFQDRRDKAMILTLASTGLRAGELMSLTLDDVDAERGVVFVRVRGTSRGKTGRERVTYLDQPAKRALFAYLKAREALKPSSRSLWLTRSGSPARPDVLRNVLDVRSRGLDANVTPHMFRRRLAVKWLVEGGSQVGLQNVAGWRTPHMASHYAAIAAAEIAQSDHDRIFRA